MREKTNQKGFIQIPILMGVIISAIIVAGIGYGVVEYKKISIPIKEAEQLTIEKEYNKANDKLEFLKNKWLVNVLGIQKDKIFSDVESNKNKLDVELAKQEIKDIKEELQQFIQPMMPSVIVAPTPEKLSVELKIEKCKSIYVANKNEMVIQYDNYQLPKLKVELEDIAQNSYQECMTKCIEDAKNTLGVSFISGETSALISNSCKLSVCNNWTSFVAITSNAIRNKELDKIEQQLQLEYQQCLIQ